MPETIVQAFQRTGTSHILALSGFNITILIAWVMIVVRLGGRRPHAIGAATLVVIWFMLITSMSASVVRAGIMGLLSAWAGVADRMAFTWLILLEAVTVMVMLEPAILPGRRRISTLCRGNGPAFFSFGQIGAAMWLDPRIVLVFARLVLPRWPHLFPRSL